MADKPTIPPETGGKIKYFRELKGLTQAKLAKKLGCTTATVNYVERGRKSLSDSRALDADGVAEALDISPLLLRETPQTAAEMLAELIPAAGLLGLKPSITGEALEIDFEAPRAKEMYHALRAWRRVERLHENGSIDDEGYIEWLSRMVLAAPAHGGVAPKETDDED